MSISGNSHPPLRVPLADSTSSKPKRKDGGDGNAQIAKHGDPLDSDDDDEEQKSEGQPNAASGSTR